MLYFQKLVKETAALDPIRTLTAKNTSESCNKAKNQVIKRGKAALKSLNFKNIKISDDGWRKTNSGIAYDIEFTGRTDKLRKKEIKAAFKSEFSQIKHTLDIATYVDAISKEVEYVISMQFEIPFLNKGK